MYMGVLYNNNQITNAFTFELILNTSVSQDNNKKFINLILDATDEFSNVKEGDGYNLKFILDPGNGFPDFKLQYSLEDTGIAKLIDFMEDVQTVAQIAAGQNYSSFVKCGVYSQKQITTKMNTPEISIKFRAFHSKTQPQVFKTHGVSTYDMVLPYLIAATSPLTMSVYENIGDNFNAFIDNLKNLKTKLTNSSGSEVWTNLKKVANLVQLVGDDPEATEKHDIIVEGAQGADYFSSLLNQIQDSFTSAIGHVSFNIKMGISLYNKVYENKKSMWGISNFSYTPSMQFFIGDDGKPKPYYIDFELGLKAIQIPNFYDMLVNETVVNSEKNK